LLYVSVVLDRERLRVLHIDVTAHPTAAWTAQQVPDKFSLRVALQWKMSQEWFL